MNIFVLSLDPRECAKMHCDKHVVKMILETAQILCSVCHIFGCKDVPYKATHKKHPCVIWAYQSRMNFFWLVALGLFLCEEYTFRYEKVHKSRDVIIWCHYNMPSTLPDNHLTQFAQAMPDDYRDKDPVKAYRAYYIGEKQRLLKYAKGRDPPKWIDENIIQ